MAEQNQIPEKHLITNGKYFFKEYFMPDKSSSINMNKKFASNFKNEDEAFYYIYALLHSKDYNKRYKHELLKGSPRLPLLRDSEEYIDIGKKLVELHINYESQKCLPELNIVFLKDNPNYRVEKMKYHSIFKKNVIIFNQDIEIHNIPLRAYDYKVSGRSAIDWIIEQYKIREYDNLDIIDNPNTYSEDPKYIFNLLLSVITLSIKTLDLIDKLPELDESN